ncbi:hypothetical protein STEG23_001516 [Scotinomys teguina]
MLDCCSWVYRSKAGIIHTSATEDSLPTTISSTTDDGFPQLQGLHGQRILSRLLAVAQTSDINMAPAQIMGLCMVPSGSINNDLTVSSGSSTHRRHQHGLW